MRISKFLYVAYFVFLGCGCKHKTLIEQWNKDNTGCLGNRTWNNFESIVKEIETKKIDSIELTKIFGMPQEIIQAGKEEIINKYIVSQRCFKGLTDTCFGVIIFNNKKHRIISFEQICQ